MLAVALPLKDPANPQALDLVLPERPGGTCLVHKSYGPEKIIG
jgi:hypothetical protein